MGDSLEEIKEQVKRAVEEAQSEIPEDDGNTSGSAAGHSGHHHRSHSGHHHSHGRRHRKKMKTWQRVVLVVCAVFLLTSAALVSAFLALRYIGRENLRAQAAHEAPSLAVLETEEAGSEEILDAYTVKYQGSKYRYNENLFTILFMGIDRSDLALAAEGSGEGGQSDSNFLLTIDSVTGKTRLVAIPRDTMTDIEFIGINGDSLGKSTAQLALGYSFGDGREGSCQSMVDAVSNLFYGLPIHGYCAIDLKTIATLNDAVGGVTLSSLADFPKMNPPIKEGETVTLTGKQAHTYVRSRYNIGDGTDLTRMERQKQYLLAFLSTAMKAVRQDFTLVPTLYNALTDDMVTSLSLDQITYLATLALKMESSQIDFYSLSGESRQGNIFMEFYPDEDALYELILNVFYTCEEEP